MWEQMYAGRTQNTSNLEETLLEVFTTIMAESDATYLGLLADGSDGNKRSSSSYRGAEPSTLPVTSKNARRASR